MDVSKLLLPFFTRSNAAFIHSANINEYLRGGGHDSRPTRKNKTYPFLKVLMFNVKQTHTQIIEIFTNYFGPEAQPGDMRR